MVGIGRGHGWGITAATLLSYKKLRGRLLIFRAGDPPAFLSNAWLTYLPARIFFFNAVNSVCVIAPDFNREFAFAISSAWLVPATERM